MQLIRGKAWRFGDNVDTDAIIPGKYLRSADASVFAAHVLEGIDPDFAKKVRKGDVIVAGRNFGSGSSREQAVLALKHAGVACIVAESFARIFFRNAINVGLPIIEAKADCREGDTVEIGLGKGRVTCSGNSFSGVRLPGFLLTILMDGGLVEHRKKHKNDIPY